MSKLKTNQDDGRLGEIQLELGARAPIQVGTCFTNAYVAMLVVIVLIMLALCLDIYSSKQKSKRQQSKIKALHTKLRIDKNIIKADERKLQTAVDNLLGKDLELYETIRANERVELIMAEKKLILKSGLSFKVDVGRNVVRADFENDVKAIQVLADAAEILKLFPSAVLMIEGHTSTPVEDLDTFWNEVAYARAERVKTELVFLGVEEYRMMAIGLPGPLGSNQDKVVITFVDM